VSGFLKKEMRKRSKLVTFNSNYHQNINGKRYIYITEQNRIYFNKLVQGTSFEMQSVHA